MENNLLTLSHISKRYQQGKEVLCVLNDVSLTVARSQTMALVGPSGCGKSTLLHIAALLDSADEGMIEVMGTQIDEMSDRECTLMRHKHIGFIYQFHHLLAEFSALENVVIPLRMHTKMDSEIRDKAAHLLTKVGLDDRINHLPSELSGGEQQRVAIARALANDPDILLADEPTGNLDVMRSEEIFDLIIQLADERGMTAMVATHNPDLARRMQREVTLQDGHIRAIR